MGDEVRHLLTISRAVWNATVGVYDPYRDNFVSILEFPGITRTGTLHIGGVAWDKYTNLWTILVDSANPWATNGADVSGDNLLIKYDPDRKTVLWTLNITAVTNGVYGAFQDVEHDVRGNTYVVGTFPGTLMKADAHGRAIKPWYLPPVIEHTKMGFGGLADVGNDILLSQDGDGRVYRFNMQDELRGTPVLVPTLPRGSPLYNDTDAIYAPPKYDGKVLLVASHLSGLQVLRSRDGRWRTAEYLGTIPNPIGGDWWVVAATQMGKESVYMIGVWLTDPWVPGQVAGNRTEFPLPEITDQIEALLRRHD